MPDAWAVYDNEPPTGNEAEGAEPGPELRCDFCNMLEELVKSVNE
ncbi:hypothetical protein [Pedobacter riviphilus]|nr:hypothetical protein [Pedobacter riviphilus]